MPMALMRSLGAELLCVADNFESVVEVLANIISECLLEVALRWRRGQDLRFGHPVFA